MDVRLLLCGAISALVCACSNGQNSVSGVYQESSACSGAAVPNSFIVKWKNGDIDVKKYRSRLEMENELGPQVEKIEMIESDHLLSINTGRANRLRDTNTATDHSTGLTITSGGANWGQNIVQVAGAYSQNIYGDGIKVAIVDTGVDITHPQLAGQIAINAGETGTYVDSKGVSHNRSNNLIDDDGNGYIDDVNGYDFNANSSVVTDNNGHGTHVSGIVAADPAFGSVQGIAPKVKIIPASFMDSTGSGTMGNAARAIRYAVNRGAKVISASWGGDQCDTVLRQQISSLEGMGVLFVVASGNGDQYGNAYDLDQVGQYPAAFGFAGQITVGASGTTDRMASFSNYSTRLVHLLAPGVSIISTWPGNSTHSDDGTSMATPFVSGAAALLMSAFPTASVSQVKQALIDSVDTGNFPVVSSGRLNITKAIAALRTVNP